MRPTASTGSIPGGDRPPGESRGGVLPGDLPRYRRKIDEALSGEAEGYDHEHRIRRPDGEVRWVHGQAEVVRGEGESR
jgi:PAS domain S-box-containing protein